MSVYVPTELPSRCALVNQTEGCLGPRPRVCVCVCVCVSVCVCVCVRVGDGLIFVFVFFYSYANTTGQRGGVLGNLSSEAVAHIHGVLGAHTDIKPANICFRIPATSPSLSS